MSRFQRLLFAAVASGTIAGLAWFTLQYFAVIPLITSAETYEAAAHQAAHGDSHQHTDEGWRPDDGWQRASLTGLATVLTGIGFASMLFGVIALTGRSLDATRGALWGLSAFVCFGFAPALGLPPQPPGVAVADVWDRQIWWGATVLGTAAGLYLMSQRSRSWLVKLVGLVCLVLPHVIGAPVASGENVVPAALVRQFMTASLVTTGLFWLTLGALGGAIHRRYLAVASDPGQ